MIEHSELRIQNSKFNIHSSGLFAALLTTLLAAPLAFGAVQPWAWATLAMTALLMLAWWAVANVRQGVVRIFWLPHYTPILAMMALGAVQLFGHSTLDPIATRESLLKVATAAIFFFLASQLFCTASPRRSSHRVTESRSEPGYRAPALSPFGVKRIPHFLLDAWSCIRARLQPCQPEANKMAALAAAAENQGLKPKSKIAPSSARLKPCPDTSSFGRRCETNGFELNPRCIDGHMGYYWPLEERAAIPQPWGRRVRGSRADTASAPAWRVIGLAVTVYISAVGLFAIVQFFSSPGLIYWTVKPRWGGWVFGPYVNHNHYAGLMEMLIPLAAVYVLSRPRRHPARLLLGFAVCMAVASVLLSGSRGGLFALGAEVLILTVILLRRAPGRRWAAAGTLGIVVAAALFLWMDRGDILKRFSTVASLTSAPEATFGERRLVALDALRMFRHHPLIGTGLGSFETAYPPYRSFPSDFDWDHAHNDYAEALAETGLAGLAMILAGLVLFLSLAFRNLGERLGHEPGWMQLGAALGCCGLLVHSLVDFNLHIPANAAWFAFCAGLASCSAQGSEF
jgi:O-antigen ligase